MIVICNLYGLYIYSRYCYLYQIFKPFLKKKLSYEIQYSTIISAHPGKSQNTTGRLAFSARAYFWGLTYFGFRRIYYHHWLQILYLLSITLRIYVRQDNIIRSTQSQCRWCIKYPEIFLPNICSNLAGKYIVGNVFYFYREYFGGIIFHLKNMFVCNVFFG